MNPPTRRAARLASLAAAAVLFFSAAGRAAADEGLSLSIAASTQGNSGPLSIGVGFVGVGPYRDEKDARREGLHASLSIAIAGRPDQFRQPDVREGQTLTVAGYRILIEKLVPGEKGVVIVRLWAPPKPPARKSWLRFFGL